MNTAGHSEMTSQWTGKKNIHCNTPYNHDAEKVCMPDKAQERNSVPWVHFFFLSICVQAWKLISPFILLVPFTRGVNYIFHGNRDTSQICHSFGDCDYMLVFSIFQQELRVTSDKNIKAGHYLISGGRHDHSFYSLYWNPIAHFSAPIQI